MFYVSMTSLKRPLYEQEFLPSGKAKAHGVRAFIPINDRLSTLLTPLEEERTIEQRSLKECLNHGDKLLHSPCNDECNVMMKHHKIIRGSIT